MKRQAACFVFLASVFLLAKNSFAAEPQISNVAASNISMSSVTITWTTDEPSTSQVEYGSTTIYGTSTTGDPTLVTSHSVMLNWFRYPGTYNFIVISTDSQGSGNSSPNATFLITNVDFSNISYWDTLLPSNVGVDPNSQAFITYLTTSGEAGYGNYIHLSGDDVGSAPSLGEAWARPYYWASPNDPCYSVIFTTNPQEGFPEMSDVYIPIGAEADNYTNQQPFSSATLTSDGEINIYNSWRNMVFQFHHAYLDSNYPNTAPAYCNQGTTGTWVADGGGVWYLNSNGLNKSLKESDSSSTGHRGMAGNYMAIRYDEIMNGVIPHMLELFVAQTAPSHVFPYIGDEQGPGIIPEGARIRIKASVNLASLGLKPAALIVATALQNYGATIGDRDPDGNSIKVEEPIAEGRGDLWAGVLGYKDLQNIPMSDFEVIPLGWPYNTSAVLTSISLSPSTAAITVGGNQQFSATALDQNGFQIIQSTLTFTSTNTVVAAINSRSGLSQGLENGFAGIYASSGTVYSSLSLLSVGMQIPSSPTGLKFGQ